MKGNSRKVTVREVARAAGVSPGTVSRVFNARGYLSAEIRRRVIEAARRTGYRFKRRSIAVIVSQNPDFHGYSGESLSAVLEELNRRNFLAEILPIGSLPLLVEHQLSGAVALVLDNGLERIWAENWNLPMVCFQTVSRHRDNIYTVGSDNRQGIHLALNYLREQGHEKIGYVSWYATENFAERDNPDYMLRKELYLDWCGEQLPYTVEAAEELDRALAGGCTAFLVVGESNELQFLHELIRRGLRVPEDISVIAFERSISPLLNPPMTTIGQQFPLLAAAALGMLENLISRREQAHDVRLPYVLNERGSVRRRLPGGDQGSSTLSGPTR